MSENEAPPHPTEPLWQDSLRDMDAESADLARRVLEENHESGESVVRLEPAGEDRWRLGVGMSDRLGSLSLTCGLLTVAGLDIKRADTITVAKPRRQRVNPSTRSVTFGRRIGARRPTRRRGQPANRPPPMSSHAVMLFDLRQYAERPPDWDALQRDLAALADQIAAGRIEDARSLLIDRFADALRDLDLRDGARLPMDISTDAESSPHFTLLAIRSADTAGFLFAFSNALAVLRVNIARAKIRTENGRVRNTFWLTGASDEKIRSESRLRQIRAAAALIKQFTHLLPVAPDPEQALRQFNALTARLLSDPNRVAEIHALETPDVLETLAEMMGMSRFLWEDFLRMQLDNLLPALLDTASLERRRTADGLRAALASEWSGSVPERAKALNRFKDREMFGVDLRYITGRIDAREFGAEQASLADVVTEKAFELGLESARERHGAPRRADGAPCPWAVIGLGKFGGGDMGFGSDIELIFVYESEGATDGDSPAPNSAFFEDAARGFVQTIETRQQSVFEIDMRLRPYGSKGPMASSLSAFADYFRTDGDARQFERMALVRARPIAGDRDFAERVMSVQRAFVYSDAPLDLDNIRHLRERQQSELVERGAVNAKLSPGGLVDIEYFVQTLQIAHGRRDPTLRQPNTLDALEALRAAGHVADDFARAVHDSYIFLRRLTEALRVVRGSAKDLHMPPVDSREFEYLAHRMGVSPSSALSELTARHMAVSRGVWSASEGEAAN